MAPARIGQNVSLRLQVVMERAKDPNIRIHTLAHLVNEDALERAYGRIRKDAAVGVDGTTKEQYGQDLELRLRDLHQRLRGQKYRHQPIRRVLIAKGKGKTRPIGVSSMEDKIVQGALREVLEAVYEPMFRDCSYGFRPRRSAHDAIRALNRMALQGIGWILEADISSYFDTIDRAKLREMLQNRVADKSLLRLVGKCLHVGVLQGEEFSYPEEGTSQGSIISPLLGNVYLHHVLDVWFEDVVRPALDGQARLIRYADDFVIGFTKKEDAERTLTWLEERMQSYGLTLHPEKTRIIPFARPRYGAKQAETGTFDFVGFTAHWARTRKGGWVPRFKTRKASIRSFLTRLGSWCRRHRHLPHKEQHAALTRRLRGHYQYFGVNGNHESLERVNWRARWIWLKWLRRRSQRGKCLTWERFASYLKAFPLPKPRIVVQIWERP